MENKYEKLMSELSAEALCALQEKIATHLNELETQDAISMATCLVADRLGIVYSDAAYRLKTMNEDEKGRWISLARAAISHIPYLKRKYA